MITKEIIFEEKKVLDLVNSINSICLNCDNIGTACNICPVENSKSILDNTKIDSGIYPQLKRYTLLNPDNQIIDDFILEFNKNDIMITQNSVEDICVGCNHVGTYCMDCNIHQIRRDLASLTIKEIKMDIVAKESNVKSCGTSCSTGGCSTKKKKK